MEVHILTHPRANRDTQCYYKSMCLQHLHLSTPMDWC